MILPTPYRVSPRHYQDRSGWFVYFWCTVSLPSDLWQELGKERADLRCVWCPA